MDCIQLNLFSALLKVNFLKNLVWNHPYFTGFSWEPITCNTSKSKLIAVQWVLWHKVPCYIHLYTEQCWLVKQSLRWPCKRIYFQKSPNIMQPCRRKLCLHCIGGVDSFMTRIDMAQMSATSIPDRTINSEVYGMKLCRLPRLEKVQDISPVIECNLPSRVLERKTIMVL